MPRLAQRLERAGSSSRGRGDEHALHPLLGEHVEVRGLPAGSVVAVAEDHGEPGGLGDVLDAAGDVGEERVGDVEHDQADRAAAAGAQLPGRLVADEAERGDRGVDPLAGSPG